MSIRFSRESNTPERIEDWRKSPGDDPNKISYIRIINCVTIILHASTVLIEDIYAFLMYDDRKPTECGLQHDHNVSIAPKSDMTTHLTWKLAFLEISGCQLEWLTTAKLICVKIILGKDNLDVVRWLDKNSRRQKHVKPRSAHNAFDWIAFSHEPSLELTQ